MPISTLPSASTLFLATGATAAMGICGVGRDPQADNVPECPLGRLLNTAYEPARCMDPGSVAQYGRCSKTPLCEPGLICEASEQLCLPDVAAGDSCEEDADCGLMWCNHGYAPPECQPEGLEGDPCAAKKDCAPNLTCDTLRCTTP
jgi:hypothetical protein